MRSPRAAFSGITLALLALSLGGKALSDPGEQSLSLETTNTAIIKNLNRQGYVTRRESHSDGTEIIYAAIPGCRIALRPEPSGDRIDDFRLHTVNLPAVQYRFEGVLYGTYPGLRAATRRVVAATQLKLGLPSEKVPVILSFAYSSECKIEAVAFPPGIG